MLKTHLFKQKHKKSTKSLHKTKLQSKKQPFWHPKNSRLDEIFGERAKHAVSGIR